MCFEMSVNKIGLWLGNLCVFVEEGAGWVPLGPEVVGVMHGLFLLCVLPLLPLHTDVGFSFVCRAAQTPHPSFLTQSHVALAQP